MIEAKDLSKRYGSTLAVDRLSFQVKPGIVTGFLGPNGSGKSTTMRMILGLDYPTGGTAKINGKPYRQLRVPLREVGALIDAKAIHGGRSAYSHLLGLAQSNAIPRKRVREVLAIVGLESVARKRSKGFSLGMGQRLGIAAALLGDPGILLFDEPVNGLDPDGIVWIRNLMKSFAAEGRTVLVSSHLMSEMALTADHLIVIGRGRLLADMSTADFIRHSSQNFVRVRSPQLTELSAALTEAGAKVQAEDGGTLAVTEFEMERVGDLAAERGLRIHELSAQQASLEAAFMELTGEAVEYHGHTGAAEQDVPAQQAKEQPAEKPETEEMVAQ